MTETPLELIRGDRATLVLSGLLDGDDAPAVFGVDDTLTFTAKYRYADSDLAAVLQLDGDSIELDGDTATITILASDWAADAIARDRPFVWDVQLAVGGDPDQIVTIDRGTGILRADTTLADPPS